MLKFRNHRRAAASILDEAGLLREALDAIDDGVYVVSPDRRIVFWNRGAERITGFAAHEVLERPCGDALLKHVDNAGKTMCGARCPLADVKDGGATESERVFCLHKAGHRVPVRVRATPVFSSSGTYVGAIEVFQEECAEVRLREQIEDLKRVATTDALTAMPNRRRFEEALDVAIYSLDRYEHPFALALFDIDHFKEINDTWGHDVGDEVLRAVGLTLGGALRKADIAARWGGEEFAALLAGVPDMETLEHAVDRLRAIASGIRIPHGDETIAPTVSVGATLARTCETATQLFRRADEALYASKRGGRNRTTVR